MGPQGGQLTVTHLKLQYKIYQNKQRNTTKQNKNINGIQEQSDNRDIYASEILIGQRQRLGEKRHNKREYF